MINRRCRAIIAAGALADCWSRRRARPMRAPAAARTGGRPAPADAGAVPSAPIRSARQPGGAAAPPPGNLDGRIQDVKGDVHRAQPRPAGARGGTAVSRQHPGGGVRVDGRRQVVRARLGADQARRQGRRQLPVHAARGRRRCTAAACSASTWATCSTGAHELVAFFIGKGPHDRDYRRGATAQVRQGHRSEVHRTADQGFDRQSCSRSSTSRSGSSGRCSRRNPMLAPVRRGLAALAALAGACRRGRRAGAAGGPAATGARSVLRGGAVRLLPGALLLVAGRPDGGATFRPRAARSRRGRGAARRSVPVLRPASRGRRHLRAPDRRRRCTGDPRPGLVSTWPRSATSAACRSRPRTRSRASRRRCRRHWRRIARCSRPTC